MNKDEAIKEIIKDTFDADWGGQTLTPKSKGWVCLPGNGWLISKNRHGQNVSMDDSECALIGARYFNSNDSVREERVYWKRRYFLQATRANGQCWRNEIDGKQAQSLLEAGCEPASVQGSWMFFAEDAPAAAQKIIDEQGWSRGWFWPTN